MLSIGKKAFFQASSASHTSFALCKLLASTSMIFSTLMDEQGEQKPHNVLPSPSGRSSPLWSKGGDPPPIAVQSICQQSGDWLNSHSLQEENNNFVGQQIGRSVLHWSPSLGSNTELSELCSGKAINMKSEHHCHMTS